MLDLLTSLIHGVVFVLEIACMPLVLWNTGGSSLQCDLASEGFLGNVNQLEEYCRDKNFHAWFETSAKENIGIDEAARSLVGKVLTSVLYFCVCVYVLRAWCFLCSPLVLIPVCKYQLFVV